MQRRFGSVCQQCRAVCVISIVCVDAIAFFVSKTIVSEGGRRLVGLGHKPSKLAIPGSNPGDRTPPSKLKLICERSQTYMTQVSFYGS